MRSFGPQECTTRVSPGSVRLRRRLRGALGRFKDRELKGKSEWGFALDRAPSFQPLHHWPRNGNCEGEGPKVVFGGFEVELRLPLTHPHMFCLQPAAATCFSSGSERVTEDSSEKVGLHKFSSDCRLDWPTFS